MRGSDTSHSTRPVLINHKVSGDRDLRVDVHQHPDVLPTGDTEHFLTDLTSVRLRKTNTWGSSNANSRDVLSVSAVRKMGQ